MAKVVYASNGGVIGDGIRITRVSNSGQKLEVLVDPKAERWSEVVLVSDETAPVDPPPVEPDPDPVPPSDTTPPVVKINRVGTDLIVYSSTEAGTAFWMVNSTPGALLGGFIASAGNSFPVSKTGTSERVIDLSGLPAGVYYMHLTVRDAAGNYSADAPQVFEVVP